MAVALSGSVIEISGAETGDNLRTFVSGSTSHGRVDGRTCIFSRDIRVASGASFTDSNFTYIFQGSTKWASNAFATLISLLDGALVYTENAKGHTDMLKATTIKMEGVQFRMEDCANRSDFFQQSPCIYDFKDVQLVSYGRSGVTANFLHLSTNGGLIKNMTVASKSGGLVFQPDCQNGQVLVMQDCTFVGVSALTANTKGGGVGTTAVTRLENLTWDATVWDIGSIDERGQLYVVVNPNKPTGWEKYVSAKSAGLYDMYEAHTHNVTVVDENGTPVPDYRIQLRRSDNTTLIYDKVTGRGTSQNIGTFAANSDSNTKVYNEVIVPENSTSLIFKPKTWHNSISMRVGLQLREPSDFVVSPFDTTTNDERSVSGSYNNRADFRASSLDSATCWLAATSNTSQWIEIPINSITQTVTSIVTQGRNGANQWVKTYEAEAKSAAGVYTNIGTYIANTDQSTKVTNAVTAPAGTVAIRIKPLTWNGAVAMRVNIGVESNSYMDASTNDERSVSSSYNNRADFRASRLDSATCWLASTNNASQWLEIPFDEQGMRITHIVTQGRNGANQWIKTFDVQAKQEDLTYTNIGTFNGNTDQSTKVINALAVPDGTIAIRIKPVTWNGAVALRAGLVFVIDLTFDTFDDLVRRVSSVLADSDPSTGNYRSRLDSVTSWTADTNDLNQWIEIPIPDNKIVHALVTQGRADTTDWVTEYDVEAVDGRFAGKIEEQEVKTFDQTASNVFTQYTNFRMSGISYTHEIKGGIRALHNGRIDEQLVAFNDTSVTERDMSVTLAYAHIANPYQTYDALKAYIVNNPSGEFSPYVSREGVIIDAGDSNINLDRDGAKTVWYDEVSDTVHLLIDDDVTGTFKTTKVVVDARSRVNTIEYSVDAKALLLPNSTNWRTNTPITINNVANPNTARNLLFAIKTPGASINTDTPGTGNGQVQIVQSVNLNITCQDSDKNPIQGAVVYFYKVETDGSRTSISSKQITDANGYAEVNSNYDGDFDLRGHIRKASTAPFYKSASVVGTVTEAGFSSTVLMIPDG